MRAKLANFAVQFAADPPLPPSPPNPTPPLTGLLLWTGRYGSRTAKGGCTSYRVPADRPGLHEVRAEAFLLPVKLGAELHQHDRLEILRHQRVCAREADEVSAGRGGDVVALTSFFCSRSAAQHGVGVITVFVNIFR